LHVALLTILVAPVLEELAFRGALLDLLQAMLRRFGMADAGPVTRANVITSIAFAACHLPYQPAPVAVAILLPSLLLGRMREVTGSVLPCVALHAWFNAWYVAVFAR
jgi:membrane protease YdiL (CAAX protease family)